MKATRADITTLQVDAIVNAANRPTLLLSPPPFLWVWIANGNHTTNPFLKSKQG